MSQLGFSDSPQKDPAKARVHLLPVPLESSVSYGGGTAGGPRAILEASYQLENYDREFDCEPGPEYGIYTYPVMQLSDKLPAALEQIAERVAEVYDPERLLGVLGGEHSLSAPVVEGLLRRVEGDIVIIQIDAHCDLRDTYEETPHSHACVARRFLEQPRVSQILQLGIRSLCSEEARVLKNEPRVRAWYAEEVHAESYWDEFREAIRGKNTFLTLDVDGFDPSVVPSTGTPEPNGLSYIQVENIVRAVIEESNLFAFDCVELAPTEGSHAADFFVAKFLYRLMNLRLGTR